MNKAEAIEKAAKLLRLATSPNQPEAERAAAKAHEIMVRYELDAEALELAGKSEQPAEPIKDFGFDPLDCGANHSTWTGRLIVIIAHAHGCQAYKKHQGGYGLIGRASDVQTVRYLYSWIRTQVERIAEADCVGCGRTYWLNFRLGMVETISRKLEEAHKAAAEAFKAETVATGNSQALVLVNNAIAKRDERLSAAIDYGKKVVGLRSGGGSRSNYNAEARSSGRGAGHRVSINASKGNLSGSQRQLN